MAATQTLSQLAFSRKSPISKTGVLTLSGFGVRVRMQTGHLEIEDGVGLERRKFRLPRVGHGLKRLAIIGSDGFLTLAALKWLADQNASVTLLDRRGKVLFVTGPTASSDARLRRAQAMAAQTGADVTIARELISQKLAGQERVARDKLHDDAAAQIIADYRLALAEAETLDSIRTLESRGAAAYWAAWRDVQITFPRKDWPRVPEHWRTFGTRKSLLTGSPRLATNPANAMLNYLYALLESEARLAAAALGLDPGLGFIHNDAHARDSLACDLMEAVRADVDTFVLDWVTRQPLSRSWFMEQPDGNCRLSSALTGRLTETTPRWARAVAPIAEWVTRTLWAGRQKAGNGVPPPTRLTQRHKREAKGAPALSPAIRGPRPQALCPGCGKEIAPERTHCQHCALSISAKHFPDVARMGRAVAHTPKARAKQGATQRQHREAELSWSPEKQPAWLTEQLYAEKIHPLLARFSNAAIASKIGVCHSYARSIRQGRYRPHPRHWQALAALVGVSADGSTSSRAATDS